MKKLVRLLCICICIKNTALSQNYYNVNPKFEVPKSPNVTALEKYGNIPVNLAIGQVAPAIDLIKLNIRGFDLDLNLNYFNSGLKNEEIPSWAGLGWTINEIGLITRTVNGIPDDEGGLLTTSARQKHTDYLNGTQGQQKYQYEVDLFEGKVDAEFDLFSFNIMGRTGKFYISKNDVCISLPKNNLKIEYFKNSSGQIISFKITDERGVKYEFGIVEHSESFDYNQELSGYYNSTNGSAWHLTKITLINSQEINFEYKLVGLNYTKTNQSFSCPSGIATACQPSLNTSSIGISTPNRLLTRIIWNEGEIIFNSNTIRLDVKKLGAQNNLPKLDEIILKNYEGRIIKKILFHHTYFGQNDLLKLDSVEFYGVNNVKEHSYGLDYYSGQVPELTEFKSQDLWGYYNGEANTILPKISVLKPLVYRFPTSYTSPLRKPNFNFVKSGLLKKINYPTGGSTEFIYEPNKLLFKTLADIPSILFDHFENQSTLMNINSYVVNNSEYVSGQFTLTNRTLVRIETLAGQNDPSLFGTATATFSENTSTSECYNSTNYNTGYYSAVTTVNCIKILEPGTYTGSINTLSIDNYFSQGYIRVYKLAEDPNISYTTGGIRIKQIVNTSSSGNQESKYYEYPDNFNTTEVNASLNSLLRVMTRYEKGVCEGGAGTGYSTVFCGDNITVHGNILEQANSIPVFYKKVIEKVNPGSSQGYTEYLFEKGEIFYGTLYPNGVVSPLSIAWRDGSLQEKKHYGKPMGITNNILLSEEKNEFNSQGIYENLDVNIKIGLKASIMHCYPDPGYSFYYPGFAISDAMANTLSGNSFNISGSQFKTEDYKLIQKTNIQYSETMNGSLTQTTNYTYHPSKPSIPVEEKYTNSKGVTSTKKIKYSIDYGSNAFLNLSNANIIAPIETITHKENQSGLNGIVSGDLVIFSNTLPLPIETKRLNISQPIAPGTFVNSFINGSNSFVLDQNYKSDIENVFYDSYHNIIEYKESNKPVVSNIYDYKGSLLIATCINASKDNCAYSSFEADGMGNFSISSLARVTSDAFTGTKSYELSNGNISKSGLSSSITYIISYRTKNLTPFNITGTIAGYPITSATNNGWKYYEHKVTGISTITISGNGLIDELKLYPSGAMMTCYTQIPLVGITSETDPNNRTVYYEYDVFNRLSIVRDQDNKIIKKICYNYAGQPDVCSDAPSWQLTGNTRCKPCPSNSSYSTNILQNERKDLNPNSPTYNQVEWVDAGTSTSCGTGVWQNQGAPYCETSNGQNTGNQLQLVRDVNPCSSTYNQYQTILLGYNPTACPLPSSCNYSNCYGDAYRCVYGVCELGYQVYTGSYYDYGMGMWVCVYHYEWSDGTWSGDYYDYSYYGSCPLQ